ncbi:MAG: 4-hydroxy-tetrahydrodipicolinate reductase [Cuspidothrix sp.]|jgi:4-hydroxy-tetrahydrodipicolinate reductase|uniref:4-hydroxy-tetrahydrodipicolinate reductase n=1 Tax=Cuspidothrix issatschenkoi CHARLIE-1 TaxID=2052836 RepID=A0A2S6CXZ6_9CYAN|nr:4-hydroxy-tetrahydrodipicolinate reductase [Cuspidothrix issatschenkoi]PPJ64592.1 4-hydroxy-tetrahydrodipicolinate reductase [Cuspidothrix issatschenkoi CHARLIE-1]
MSNQGSIPVIVNGAAGKMGREVIKAVAQASDLVLMGAIDTTPEHQDKDAGELAGLSEPLEVPITNQLEPMLGYVAGERQMQPGVIVDFTHPDVVYDNIRSAIAYGIRPVVGTTGLSPAQLQELSDFAEKASTGCLVIPNFSIGMVLLQEAAVRASQYFDHVEIIELHHNQKADAPSGTAIQTAQLLAEMGKSFNTPIVEETEKIAGARGSLADEGIRIHSVRLPGLIAHQEVIFGAAGQIYTLRHDTSDRSCYMPGVILAIRKVNQLKSLVYGLEKIL